ncbi:MAG TPA: acetylornithine deacetylase, partial [Bacteroidales bacterium]|nr:acetylornithine deacetylase [Bacteroidales bacterium]
MYDHYYREAVDLLKHLITLPAPSRSENARADYLTQWLTAKGLTVNRELNNLWCVAPGYDVARPTLLLNSHIDTVKPVDGWSRDPFTPEVSDGRLYGLGSNDAGASLCSLIQV